MSAQTLLTLQQNLHNLICAFNNAAEALTAAHDFCIASCPFVKQLVLTKSGLVPHNVDESLKCNMCTCSSVCSLSCRTVSWQACCKHCICRAKSCCCCSAWQNRPCFSPFRLCSAEGGSEGLLQVIRDSCCDSCLCELDIGKASRMLQQGG